MIEPIIIGAIGGLLYYMFPIIDNYHKPRELRLDLKDVFCIPLIIIGPALGSLFVYLHLTETTMSKWLAFHIGFSGPLILKQTWQSLLVPESIPLTDDNQ